MSAFVSLTRQFGGTRFGPYETPHIALGSDAQQCHIVLPAELGIYPIHCWLTQDGGDFVVQPTERGARVFSHAGRSPTEVNGAERLGSGQRFSLVTPDGPCFIVERGNVAASADMPVARQGVGGRQPTGRSAGTLGGRRAPTPGALLDEVRRRVGVSAMTNGPLAQLSHLFYRARSGALFQPRYIVAAIMVGLAGMASFCAGLGALFHLTS